MPRIYQSEYDSVVVIEVKNNKVYLSDDLDDSIIVICHEKWSEIKKAIDREFARDT